MEQSMTTWISHPENLDRDSLYELRSLLALYPYCQPARLLMLQNLYILHDPAFDEELKRAAIYITDRKKIFRMVEAAHYKISPPRQKKDNDAQPQKEGRTMSLIDNFLQQIPEDSEEENSRSPKRKPTPADAAIDYVAFLMQDDEPSQPEAEQPTPHLKGQSLIDNFINNDKGKISLKEIPEYVPQLTADDNDPNAQEEGYFTETLAKIYIKQGRYLKALEIIQRLNLQIPKKNAYFADQIRFLEKLIINSNRKR